MYKKMKFIDFSSSAYAIVNSVLILFFEAMKISINFYAFCSRFSHLILNLVIEVEQMLEDLS